MDVDGSPTAITILAGNLIAGNIASLWSALGELELGGHPLSVQFTTPGIPGPTFVIEAARWDEGAVTATVTADGETMAPDVATKTQDILRQRATGYDVFVENAFGQTHFTLKVKPA